jgi:hypothetical protein
MQFRFYYRVIINSILICADVSLNKYVMHHWLRAIINNIYLVSTIYLNPTYSECESKNR